MIKQMFARLIKEETNKLRKFAKFKSYFHHEPYVRVGDKQIRQCLDKSQCSDQQRIMKEGLRSLIMCIPDYFCVRTVSNKPFTDPDICNSVLKF